MSIRNREEGEEGNTFKLRVFTKSKTKDEEDLELTEKSKRKKYPLNVKINKKILPQNQ